MPSQASGSRSDAGQISGSLLVKVTGFAEQGVGPLMNQPTVWVTSAAARARASRRQSGLAASRGGGLDSYLVEEAGHGVEQTVPLQQGVVELCACRTRP
jgi:hypothetical protein